VTEYGCLDAPDDPLSCAIAAAEYKQATIISNRDKIISENVAADIVGHEKPRITYGLYSGGTTLDVMREALERISYEFPELR
jgi:hypothetical protein